MALDPRTPSEFEQKVRANLAYIWTFAVIILISYTLWAYGHILAVLTLLLGFITGTSNNINGVFFGGTPATKKSEPTVTTNADTTNVTVTPKDNEPQ